MSRRVFLRRSLALGLALPAAGGVLGGCAVLQPPDARAPKTEPIRFGVIGDFGKASESAQQVADLVKSWEPDFIVTVGDNNYPDGSAKTIDENIGQYYHNYIGNYQGSYGPGAATNRFWPALGNHDWLAPDAQPYLDYFTLPGNERYYTFTKPGVQFFMLDSQPDEPDGATGDSIQARWLREELSLSPARWRVVIMHHSPYSSGPHGANEWMQWPYRAWGASIVLAGHDHAYERLEIDGFPYIVNGLGGGGIYPEREQLPGSQVFFNKKHGALLVDADNTRMTLQFITHEGDVIDQHELVA